MRTFIEICAAIFVITGFFAVLIFGGLAFMAVSAGGDGGSGIGTGIGVGLAAIGLVAGASITLVGGATYLLSSIDRRLERGLPSVAQTAAPILGNLDGINKYRASIGLEPLAPGQ